MWLILKRGYPCLISISEKSSVEIFLRNGFLNSAHFSTIGPTLKPFGLERVNKTPLALGLVVWWHFISSGTIFNYIEPLTMLCVPYDICWIFPSICLVNPHTIIIDQSFDKRCKSCIAGHICYVDLINAKTW